MPSVRNTVIIICALAILPGCQETTSTPSGTQPGNSQSQKSQSASNLTLSEAVSKIIELSVPIRDGFTSGDIDMAHGPLHDIGKQLDELSGVAEAGGAAEDQLKSIESTVAKLMDAYGNVDKTLHGREGSTYEEEQENIDACLRALAELAGVDMPEAAPGEPGNSEPAPLIEVEDATDPIEVVPVEAAPAE